LTQFESNEYYNSLLTDPNNPLFDRALLGQYAPGSTYKIGSALAALENGLISNTTKYHCSGTYPLYHNPTCLGIHGDLNVVRAIGVSCNCFSIP
jgi:penicillin-binding protein 2